MHAGNGPPGNAVQKAFIISVPEPLQQLGPQRAGFEKQPAWLPGETFAVTLTQQNVFGGRIAPRLLQTPDAQSVGDEHGDSRGKPTDAAFADNGATTDETIGSITIEAKPTFLITCLLDNPAK